MSYDIPSDEVAEDYKKALEDLTMNSRYEISNLTVIAKENTEHALAISEALKNHIKKTSPQKKLPAFYVLDSVVKNVGTPYTIFFGRQLYSTFMEAYALVDHGVRRKMDEMLKTWKEPVPGSIDTRPVFPPEVTRPIENALIKARTSAVQAHQEHLRSQQQYMARGRQITPATPYRQTPTPPTTFRQQAPPNPASTYQQTSAYPQNGATGYPPTASPYLSNAAPGHSGTAAGYASASTPGYSSNAAPGYGTEATPGYATNANPGYSSNPPSGYQNTATPGYVQSTPAAYSTTYASQQQYPPPVNGQSYPVQQTTGYPNDYQQYGSQYSQQPTPETHSLPSRPPSQQYTQPLPATATWQQTQHQGYRASENSIERLNSDISSLITASKAEFAQSPWDSSIQTRLKALLDLQAILQNQALPPDQIDLIKDQVTQLSVASQSGHRTQTPPVNIPSTNVTAPSAPVQQPSLSSILGPGALAALLARQSTTPQPTPPQQAAAIRSPQPAHQVPYQPPPAQQSTIPASDPGSILARLRAAGILQGAAPNSSATPSNINPVGLPPGFPPPPFLSTPPTAARTPLAEIPNDVVLKPASLKIFRPHLISRLYEKLGAPCNQCGRRFQSDQDGKDKKRAHLDWHFKVNQRMSDAEKRGQHRSWYVDELEWIRSREVEGETVTSGDGAVAATLTTTKNPKLQYLPVPDDPALANTVCPICQEKFEMKWLDEAQEFVWMDAKQIGDRLYHASCHAEATKDVGNAQIKRGTPEPVLGKRKAEEDHILRTKIKTEPV